MKASPLILARHQHNLAGLQLDSLRGSEMPAAAITMLRMHHNCLDLLMRELAERSQPPKGSFVDRLDALAKMLRACLPDDSNPNQPIMDAGDWEEPVQSVLDEMIVLIYDMRKAVGS